MRTSYYFVALFALGCVILTKDWLHFAIVAAMIVLGIADQFLETYKSRNINVNLGPINVKLRDSGDQGKE